MNKKFLIPTALFTMFLSSANYECLGAQANKYRVLVDESGVQGKKVVEVSREVENIDRKCFFYDDVTDIRFEDNSRLKEIAGRSFEFTEYLRSICLPADLEQIYAEAFYKSTLESVTFEPGSKLKNIGDRAFVSCVNLKNINIPASVEIIGAEVFTSSGLESVTFEPDSKLKTIGFDAFRACRVTKIEIPSSVETIERGAFYGCSDLSEVVFPRDSNLNTIGLAFDCCPKLNRIEIPEKLYPLLKVSSRHNFEIDSCTNGIMILKHQVDIHVPKDTYVLDEYAHSAIASITFDEGSQIKRICEYAFHGCHNLERIGWPPKLEEIRAGAFSDCSALTRIVIPNSVNGIENFAFSNCENLREIVFNKGSKIKSIHSHAFKNCWNLVIRIPAALEQSFKASCNSGFERSTVDENGFISLTRRNGHIDVTEDVGRNEYENSAITSVAFKGNCVRIGDNAFQYCDRLETIDLSNIQHIGNYAFDSTNLKTIEIPRSVRTFGKFVFNLCQNLREIVFAKDMPEINLETSLYGSHVETIKGPKWLNPKTMFGYQGDVLFEI